ncbi:MAG: dienelactone hydrolase [Caulobacteraceae bacterium]|nr:dienelactone hydrolase [Caulobacteraceae bacterium]
MPSPAAALIAAAALWAGLGAPPPALAQPPSVPSIDAPELARLGPYEVGLVRRELVQPNQTDLAHLDKATGTAPVDDRVLPILIWYPATPARDAPRTRYAGTVTAEKPSDPPVRYSAEGIAVANAPPVKGGRFPLVILSHGYAGAPEAMTWVAENLASKGYVVVGISHRDPPYGDPAGFAGPLLRRPLDDAFVAHQIQAGARGHDALLAGLVDADRVALIGYSMGGYGVITQAAGGFDPEGLAAHALPARYIAPYLPGGAERADAGIDGIKAVVAISPFSGAGGAPAWTSKTLAGIKTPLLLIAGDRDGVVGFAGVRGVFDQATGAPRRLLVFENANHSIGMNPPGPEDMDSLWALDWFADPVWRRDRLIGINLHMITAFLDLYVKGETAKGAYLDVTEPRSNDAVWPARLAGPYGAYSPGAAPITVWKGFQRVHSDGLELWKGEPAP